MSSAHACSWSDISPTRAIERAKQCWDKWGKAAIEFMYNELNDVEISRANCSVIFVQNAYLVTKIHS